jgi:hypothetical protein
MGDIVTLEHLFTLFSPIVFETVWARHTLPVDVRYFTSRDACGLLQIVRGV